LTLGFRAVQGEVAQSVARRWPQVAPGEQTRLASGQVRNPEVYDRLSQRDVLRVADNPESLRRACAISTRPVDRSAEPLGLCRTCQGYVTLASGASKPMPTRGQTAADSA